MRNRLSLQVLCQQSWDRAVPCGGPLARPNRAASEATAAHGATPRPHPALRLILALVLGLIPALAGQAEAVVSVGMTVSDLDRAVDFYKTVLTFEKLDETEFHGDEIERLQGVFGARLRTARLRLGGETIELTEYLAPKGRPYPAGTRANDRWFQHIAIITGDMDAAYAHLRRFKVQHASTGPQTLPDWNKNAGGIKAFYFRDPDGHFLEILQFPPDKGDSKWRTTGSGGPYLSERQWGTVREDYSPGGAAWEYLPHDHARSKAYRWNEDGIGGICDRHQYICFALALWNGRDPILKERLFGLTGNHEGNHGEDVKECYYYLDSTPTHSYMKFLYKYPQAEFPYDRLWREPPAAAAAEPNTNWSTPASSMRTATSTSSSNTPRPPTKTF
jgi:catechol 2,3-dioxygenase-like lactoylglutathione lyase family enzyme